MRLSKHFIILCLSLTAGTLQAQSTLALVESTGGCGLLTNCEQNTVCFDILLTPGVTAEVLSYNIWVQYVGAGLSYVSDNACITENGTDNDLDELGFYRVSGVNGTTDVNAGEEIALHTICFSYIDLSDINGQSISVGGTVFDVLFSTLTYNNPPSNEGMLPEFPFLINEGSVSCFEVLSLDLLSFEARKQEHSTVLTWITAPDGGDGGFTIERSVDGHTFEAIGYVPSVPGQKDNTSYTYEDIRPISGLNHYRLHHIDQEGFETFSAIRTVRFDEGPFDIYLWPNPVSDVLNVQLRRLNSGPTTCTIYSINGQAMIRKTPEPDQQYIRFTLSGIPAGVYQLVTESREGVSTVKVVILGD